mgnify:CR=1 FL=1
MVKRSCWHGANRHVLSPKLIKDMPSCISFLATFFSEGFGYDFFLPFEAGDGVSSAALPFRIISCYRTHTACIVRDGKCEGVGGNLCRGCLSFIAGFA